MLAVVASTSTPTRPSTARALAAWAWYLLLGAILVPFPDLGRSVSMRALSLDGARGCDATRYGGRWRLAGRALGLLVRRHRAADS